MCMCKRYILILLLWTVHVLFNYLKIIVIVNYIKYIKYEFTERKKKLKQQNNLFSLDNRLCGLQLPVAAAHNLLVNHTYHQQRQEQ